MLGRLATSPTEEKHACKTQWANGNEILHVAKETGLAEVLLNKVTTVGCVMNGSGHFPLIWINYGDGQPYECYAVGVCDEVYELVFVEGLLQKLVLPRWESKKLMETPEIIAVLLFRN